MKYVHPEIETVFDTCNCKYNTLVIENADLMRRLISDIVCQLDGGDGEAVLSLEGKPVSMGKYASLIDVFVPFDVNRKALLGKITSALEKTAISAEYFEKAGIILRDVELFLESIAFEYPCDIVFSNVSISALIKAASPAVRVEGATLAEQVLDYIELVTEFDRPRLFFTLNMRAFVSDEEMELFAQSAVDHGYHIIGIESTERAMLSMENRVIIDNDLCEI